MNSLFLNLGIASWKPLLTALLISLVPWLLLAAVGACQRRRRPRLGAVMVALALVLIWLMGCQGVGEWLGRTLLRIPPPLDAPRRAALRALPHAPLAIVVLGGGAEPHAPEYGTANLTRNSMERLRYGLWLARQTGIAAGFSGGIGWAQKQAEAEARVAARIASEQFGQTLRYVEDRSRDTRENAVFTIEMLRAAGVKHVLLVTHGWHMPRAQRDFERAADGGLRIEPAPMGLAPPAERPVLRWLPSHDGYTRVYHVLHEAAGLLAGA